MDLRVFKYPMYIHAVCMFLIIIMAMFSSELILPIFMQGPMALTAAAAGLVLLPGSILNGAMSPIMGHLFDKFGPKVMMIPATIRSEEHTSELQSRGHLVCRLLL